MSRLDFYSTAAQVMPVIMLALLFEARLLERERSRSDQLIESLGMYALVLGEVAALTVLASGRDTDAALTIVIIGLSAGGYSLAWEGAVKHIWKVAWLWLRSDGPPRLRRHQDALAPVIIVTFLLVVPFVMIELLR